MVDQVLPNPDHIAIMTSPRQTSAPCPDCAVVSERLHSRYLRRLADLPWQGRPVTLQVQARRFRCLNPACSRQTFAERLSDTAPAAARRTERLGDLQCHLGLALGGEAGMRLAERLAMPTSADTLLRLVCKAASGIDPPATPRVLAVDDWAWRRGHRYGTILVDLERNTVVDLLPDRQAETLAGWLRQHPGIEVVARDRAGAYADGVRQGAPDAVQVSDRWHLLRNLGDAVRIIVDRQHAAVRRAAGQVREQWAAAPAVTPVTKPDQPKSSAAAKRSQASHARRHARYEEAARLRAAGVSLSHIAAQLGVERKTVRRWLRAGGAPLWRKPPRVSVIAPYRDHLERRPVSFADISPRDRYAMAEGCRNAALLWRELVSLGFSGRPGTVRLWAGQQRKAEPQTKVGGAGARTINEQAPSSRQVARMLMAETATLPKAEQTFVACLLAGVPGLADGLSVAKRLNQLLRRKSKESLGGLLDEAVGTSLQEFAASLRRDLAAVQAALDLPSICPGPRARPRARSTGSRC
jgi:transposase